MLCTIWAFCMPGHVGGVEREHQHVAGDRRGGAADHHDPVDHLLPGIEALGRRMVVADDAAAALDPLHVELARNVAGDPDQEDQRDPDGEREAQVVVGVLAPLRPGGERSPATSAAAGAACRR
jgi:hypothetical protein